MVPKICSIAECEKKLYSQGLCRFHLNRKKKYGDPLSTRTDQDPRCSFDGCPNPHQAKGWCTVHYQRNKTHGDPTVLITPRCKSSAESFNARTKIVRNGCIEWIGGTYANGYGAIIHNGRTMPAHRYSYEQKFGQIPDGFQIDHICHNSMCVNVDHLRMVTPKQNSENRAGAQSNSRTGVLGVFPGRREGTYFGQVTHRGKNYYCGLHESIEEAEKAVIDKRNELFTHNYLDRI